MKLHKSRILVFLLILVMILTVITGCKKEPAEDPSTPSDTGAASPTETTPEEPESKAPKYVFLFIGDGMSFPQLSALGYYNGTLEHNFTGTLKEPTPDNIPQAEMPSFTQFPIVGSCTTYDASKFVTDSASAATALASGTKTLDGIIGQDAFNNDVATIAELAHEQLGYKVGIISSVSLDHATPAAFYSHVPSRNMYYDIALQMLDSGFEYFGGGGFWYMNGYEGEQEKSMFDLAEEAGYKVANTINDIEALDGSAGKALAVNPVLDGASALPFGIDRDDSTSLALHDFVRKGIDVLGDEQGFFMMVESGKIDWACHANDAITAIIEVKELENAINVAVEFADAHPDETLIIVTGDHETGGFSNGYQGTEYDTYFSILSEQKVSSGVYTDMVAEYIPNGTTFDEAMEDIKELFGLVRPDDPDAETLANKAMILTEKDMEMFEAAYEQTMTPIDERDLTDQGYRLLYGTYRAEPIVITATHIINNKAGIGWSTTSHSALPAAVFARGAGQETFSGFYDNTDVFNKIKALLEIS